MKTTRPINVTGNPNWQYRNSAKTDVGATFARIRREQKEALERPQADEVGTSRNVAQLKLRKP